MIALNAFKVSFANFCAFTHLSYFFSSPSNCESFITKLTSQLKIRESECSNSKGISFGQENMATFEAVGKNNWVWRSFTQGQKAGVQGIYKSCGSLFFLDEIEQNCLLPS